jgi:hypothetical protein
LGGTDIKGVAASLKSGSAAAGDDRLIKDYYNSAAVVAPPIPAPTTTIFAMDFVCYVSLQKL